MEIERATSVHPFDMKIPLQNLRRRIRNWRAVRRLHRESALYACLFHRAGLRIPSDEDIRSVCRVRRQHVSPDHGEPLKVLAIYHDAGWEAASLGGTLQEMGKVIHLDPMDPAFNLGHRPRTAAFDRALLETLLPVIRCEHQAQPFDVIFLYVSGESITPKFLTELRQLGSPMVNLALNDKESFVGRVYRGRAMGARDICRLFDLCWTSTCDALPKYVVEGATPLYLPEGGNPRVHAPVSVDRDIEVSFVGQCYEPRPSTIEFVRRAGISVKTFGPGWPAGRISIQDMVAVWCRSRVTLGFSGVVGHRGVHCLKGRDFELPMSGGLYLTEHNEEIGRFYKIGEEILTWRNPQDLVDKVRWVLDHPVEAEHIRRSGQNRALRDHTWEARFRHVFDLMGVRGFTRIGCVAAGSGHREASTNA